MLEEVVQKQGMTDYEVRDFILRLTGAIFFR